MQYFFRITFKDLEVRHDQAATEDQKKTVVVAKAPRPRLTPYTDYKPNENKIRFTPAQVCLVYYHPY